VPKGTFKDSVHATVSLKKPRLQIKFSNMKKITILLFGLAGLFAITATAQNTGTELRLGLGTVLDKSGLIAGFSFGGGALSTEVVSDFEARKVGVRIASLFTVFEEFKTGAEAEGLAASSNNGKFSLDSAFLRFAIKVATPRYPLGKNAYFQASTSAGPVVRKDLSEKLELDRILRNGLGANMNGVEAPPKPIFLSGQRSVPEPAGTSSPTPRTKIKGKHARGMASLFLWCDNPLAKP
jgi:hypothetical protein